jgi:hypothetical protein
MTAWQDLPPQTRRQARMNERGSHPATEFEHAQNDSDQNSTPQRSFHESIDRQEVAAAYSRRARRSSEASAEAADARPFGAESASDTPQPSFRVRDFRPSAGGPPPAAPHGTDAEREAEPMRHLPHWAPPTVDHEGQLAYYTQAGPSQLRPPAGPAPVVDSVPSAFAVPPRPLTRRQLRELETSQGTRPQADDAPAEVVEPLVEPAPHAPFVMPAASHAAVPVDSLPIPLIEPLVEPAAEAPEVAAAPLVELPPPLGDPIRLPERPAADQVPPAMPSAPPPLVLPEPIALTENSAPAVRGPVPVPAPTPVNPGEQLPPVNRGIDLAPEIFTAPVDHWSNQNHLEIGDQGGDAFIRTVGTNSGALTTSALVMPSIPQASDITKPFGSTGEILVTGSIDLPRTLGSTGAHPARFDHSDIDALFAEEDHDYAPADASPVRAIRAVSTHTSTHGVISAKKPPSNRLPMLMAVTAGILAVGVAALFAAGMIFGYF